MRPPTTPSMQTETQRERARVAATNLCASTKVSGMYRPPKSPKYPPDTSFPSYASPCSPVCLKDISDAVMPALRPSVNFLRFAAISEAGASAATYGAANQLFNSGGGDSSSSSSSSSTRHKIVSAQTIPTGNYATDPHIPTSRSQAQKKGELGEQVSRSFDSNPPPLASRPLRC